ncbi:hypothetical protein A1O3_04720 [Capronia epimyces CBS 606.96]|uniref:Uncharacterized protein n=1 Tax=Capronia epimyces CBS 606.96 TaxID=1182542 RepID=W9XV00_9EURO|nr:uncharacterized protein A1O3_04720 [Capronia epimyces CBS 606.96]EXJ84053.1 hypothetical protein A1O3_04720 [Capronia epimyces CBS 606.96]
MSATTDDGSPETLAEVGFKVVQLFEKVTRDWPGMEDHKGLDYERVDNEQDRFNLWAVHLGLHQRGHASLDYRFRDARNLYEYARKLLVDLLHALAGSKYPLGLAIYQIDLFSTNHLLLEVNDDIFKRAGSLENGSHPTEDVDNVKSDDDDDDDDDSDDDSWDGFDDETLAQAAFKSVVDSIDRLFKLAMKVRDPATRTGFSRGYQYEQVDSESGVGLFESFQTQHIDEQHIHDLLRSYPYPSKPDDKGKQIDKYNSYLVKRLAEANNKRRRLFAYWRHHKLNQVRHAETVKERMMRQVQLGEGVAVMPPSTSARSKPTTATHRDYSKINIDDTRSDSPP